ncbi:MAG: 1-acyl-sn-glycerol-3-phosphate acyltransferase [Deltaproteobacteria bacterium]|nr:MAG: 1-acyl-sn-glycerol-3-phosphate acyltransferase [Deltaproteobacteria bacterium]
MVGRKNWIFWTTKTAGRILLLPFFCLETHRVENLPQKSAFILLPKHQRWEDIPLLSLATPRPLYYVAKYELFKNPLSNWSLRSLGGIPLNRQRPLESRRSLQSMIEFLKKGEGVVVFPEGTYYRNKMGTGHVGIVRLILSHVSLPFIPVGINYSRKGARTLVRINFGKAFYADPAASARLFLDNVMKEIAVLSGLA